MVSRESYQMNTCNIGNVYDKNKLAMENIRKLKMLIYM